MPRPKRELFNSEIFHIMSQGINKEYIFEKEQDKVKYRKLLFSNYSECNVEIISYCIMGNHVHLLIKADKIENISKFMHKINTHYALYYNKNRERVGYVFRDRYKSEEINNEKYLYNCINYIHNNPVKARITKEKSEYLYSSYSITCKENKLINKKWKDKYYNCQNEIENITFIATDEEREFDIKESVEQFLCKYKIKIEEIKYENQILIELIRILRNKNMSIRGIEKLLNVDKNKIKKLIEN